MTDDYITIPNEVPELTLAEVLAELDDRYRPDKYEELTFCLSYRVDEFQEYDLDLSVLYMRCSMWKSMTNASPTRVVTFPRQTIFVIRETPI